MSVQAVQTEILDPMQRLFLPPRQMGTSEQTQALRDYVAALQGFDRPELAGAWERVRDSHPNRGWPLPSAFVQAAREVRKERGGAQQPAKYTEEQSYAERRDRWLKIRISKLATEAMNANVTWSLKCLVINDGKTADQIDLRALIRQKASAERTAAKIRNGEPVEHRGRLVSFSPPNAKVALDTWNGQLKAEAATQREIASAAAMFHVKQ